MNTAASPFRGWRGLGAWNLYFLSKLVLAWMGALDVHVLPNLLLLAALLVPLPRPAWRRARTVAAVPVAVALYYQDTWWPPFQRLLAQREGVGSFSPAYLAELALRFVNWQVVAALALLGLGWWLLRPWLRMTTLSVAGLAAMALAAVPLPDFLARASASPAIASATGTGTGPVTGRVLDEWLATFHRQQAGLMTRFPEPVAGGAPFDVILLNVCSLSWSDLDEAGLRQNALFERMDVMFDNFNSVTSYSGPAGIRLLRASCGQAPHERLYEPAPEGCYLFANLRRLGFAEEVAFNHPGTFQGYQRNLSQHGGLAATPMDISALPRAIQAFDNTVSRRDGDVFTAWLARRQASGAGQVAFFYDTNTLHDGNRLVGADGRARRSDFRERAQMMMNDMLRFIEALEKSGRRAMVVFIPEHGAALHGDRMQIPGMRELPSPSITHIPVGVKLVGMGMPALSTPRRVSAPSSHLAVSELVARVYALNAEDTDGGHDWDRLLQDLPQTEAVSENEGAIVIRHAGQAWLRLRGSDAWTPYPEAP